MKSSILMEKDKSKIQSIIWCCDVLEKQLIEDEDTKVDAALYIRDIYFILEKLKEVGSTVSMCFPYIL